MSGYSKAGPGARPQAAPIKHVVIVGGGTAGWMAAAAAARFLNDGQRRITLVESEQIGTVGVGEATIPPIRDFNAMLGIDESEFIRETNGTIKLGIEFRNWGAIGDRYLHPFGNLGHDFQGVAFHQYWLKHRHRPDVGSIEDYSLTSQAIKAARFARPSSDPRNPLSQMTHAYQFDAWLYAAYLRRRAEGQGVTRVEGRITGVEQHSETGFVEAVLLEDGRRIAGDFFIDCSGFRALLLGETLGVPYHDWSKWLPCDRALAVPSERVEPLVPVTRATALTAGWQWRIPLQHRTGNGHVFSSAFLDEDKAAAMLLEGLDGRALDTPRALRFTAGVRDRLWEKNVVGLGLAGGFIEPLESTSIHLIQNGIARLFWLFPDKRCADVERDTYNRLLRDAYDYVRDFVVLHYKATQRQDTPFWREMGAMSVPDSLAHKIALFREKGRVMRYDHDLFAVPSWVTVMLGQHIDPIGHDPLADAMDDERVLQAMGQMAQGYAAVAQSMPSHADQVAAMSRGEI
jgi:tryptophan halogenase